MEYRDLSFFTWIVRWYLRDRLIFGVDPYSSKYGYMYTIERLSCTLFAEWRELCHGEVSRGELEVVKLPTARAHRGCMPFTLLFFPHALCFLCIRNRIGWQLSFCSYRDLDDDESVAVIAIVDHLEKSGRMSRLVRRPRRLNLNDISNRKFRIFLGLEDATSVV